MLVTIDIVGLLRRPTGARLLEVELPEGARVADALEAAGYTPEEARRVQVLVAGAPTTHDAPAPAGEALVLYLPVGGG